MAYEVMDGNTSDKTTLRAFLNRSRTSSAGLGTMPRIRPHSRAKDLILALVARLHGDSLADLAMNFAAIAPRSETAGGPASKGADSTIPAT